MPRTSYADIFDDWQQLVEALELNAEELPHLAGFKDTLVRVLEQVRPLKKRRDVLRAELNQTTSDIRVLVAEGTDAAVRVRAGVRSHYGTRSEKLNEFQLKPFRPDDRADKLAQAKKSKNGTTSEQEAPTGSSAPPAA